MLSAPESGSHGMDVDYHLQGANKSFHANKWMLTDKRASLKSRLRFFEGVVTPVVIFAAAHRAVYVDDLRKMDVAHRKLLRQVVGAPSGTDWSSEWHEILHTWNERVRKVCEDSCILSWSQQCLRQYFRFASYIASLPAQRWLSRVVGWHPSGAKSQGRPRQTWDHKLVAFCNNYALGDWLLAAQDQKAWLSLTDDFIDFTSV